MFGILERASAVQVSLSDIVHRHSYAVCYCSGLILWSEKTSATLPMTRTIVYDPREHALSNAMEAILQCSTS